MASPIAVHIGALDDFHVVLGTCFVYPTPFPWPVELPAPQWRLRALATAADRRGQGIGRAVLQGASRLTSSEPGGRSLVVPRPEDCSWLLCRQRMARGG